MENLHLWMYGNSNILLKSNYSCARCVHDSDTREILQNWQTYASCCSLLMTLKWIILPWGRQPGSCYVSGTTSTFTSCVIAVLCIFWSCSPAVMQPSIQYFLAQPRACDYAAVYVEIHCMQNFNLRILA